MDFRRLFDILSYQQATYPRKIALAQKRGLRWTTYSTEAFIDMVNRVSAGLLDLGLRRGDRVAVMVSGACPQWSFLDLGLLQLGLVSVPVSPAVPRARLQLMLNETEARYCFVDNREQYQMIAGFRGGLPHLLEVFTIEQLPDLPSLEEVLQTPTPKHEEQFQALRASIHEDDLATILYTSGAEEAPRGVMLSHRNIVSNVKALLTISPISCDDRALSFLPPSHAMERTMLYLYMAAGASIYFAEAGASLLGALREVRPHYCTATPFYLESMYNLLVEKALTRSWGRRRLILWSVDLGERFAGRKKLSLRYWLKLRLAEVLVYRRWRRLLGGRLRGVIVGLAGLQPRLARLFSAAGIEVGVGYGLTETSPLVTLNRFEPGGVRFDTAGISLPGVSVKIVGEDETGVGEIWVKGPNVMLGYYPEDAKRPNHDIKDRWFRTGDVGRMVDGRFLRFVGRKTDLFRTRSGVLVAPHPLELLLKSSPYIEQCMVVGRDRPFLAALIVPAFTALQRWCRTHQIQWTAPQYMVLHAEVKQLMQDELERLNMEGPPQRKVCKFHLLSQRWSQQTGELDSSLKMKRKTILEKYEKEIAEIYR